MQSSMHTPSKNAVKLVPFHGAKYFVLNMVRRRGLEPRRCYSLAPQASASANSATSAFWVDFNYPDKTWKTTSSGSVVPELFVALSLILPAPFSVALELESYLPPALLSIALS